MKKILTLLTAAMLTNQAFASETPQFEMQIKDHQFIPAALQVPAEQKFKLIVENLDNTAEEFESASLNKEKIIPAGKKVTLIITPLKAGEYSFSGEFHANTAQGKLIAK